MRIDKPTIDDFTNSTHNHSNNANGGTIAYSDITGTPTIPTAANSTEVTTGTDTSKYITPDALAGSTIYGQKAVEIQMVADATEVNGDIVYFYIPQSMNEMELIRATAYVTIAGTTNATIIQVRNMTKYPSNDALSGAISIASGNNVGSLGTIDTSYDDVSTGDQIKVYVTAQSTTKPKGLHCVLEFRKP